MGDTKDSDYYLNMHRRRFYRHRNQVIEQIVRYHTKKAVIANVSYAADTDHAVA